MMPLARRLLDTAVSGCLGDYEEVSSSLSDLGSFSSLSALTVICRGYSNFSRADEATAMRATTISHAAARDDS